MENHTVANSSPSHPLRRKEDRALSDGVDLKGISDDDKKEIYENIDRLVENNRIPITADLLALKPRKKGAAFPLTINILALVSVAAAFFLSARFFEQRQQALSMETEQYLSAEGKLIAQLKKESEEKLQAKDAEIGKIQEELAELDRRSADLQANMENTIQQREAQLRAELGEALEAERARLQEIGASAEDIEGRLAEFEAERQREFQSRLDSFRAEAEAEIQAREAELEQAKALNRDFLTRINKEKAELASELDRRETEMVGRFESEKAALEQETSEARRKLAELSAQSNQEKLLLDQLTSGYISVQENMDRSDYSAALKSLQTLENLIADPATTAITGMSGRLQAERFILDTLRKDLESKTYKADTDTTSMVQAAEALLSAREIAQRGTAALETGNLQEAENYYSRAIESLPSIYHAYKSLLEIKQEKTSQALSREIIGAGELIAGGNYTGAVEGLRLAILTADAENAPLYEQALKGIEDAYSLQRRSAVQAKDRELAKLTETQKEELVNLEADLQLRITNLEKTLEEVKKQVLEKEEALLLAQEALAEATGEHKAMLEEQKALHTEELAQKDAALEETQGLHSEELAEKDAALEELRARLEEEASVREERIAALTSEIKATGEEIAGLQTMLSVYEELTTEFLSYQGRIETLLSTDREDQYKLAEDLYARFLQENAETLFPGIAGLSETVTAARVRESGTQAAVGARRTAFKDILLYTDYLSESLTGGAPEEKETISRMAREETDYNDTILQIQRLVETAGTGAGASTDTLFRQSIFIGTVSYIIGDKIVIERMIAFEADTGDSLLIKRKTAAGRDETIAEASIHQITPQKVEAVIGTITDDRKPQVMDLVYLVTD